MVLSDEQRREMHLAMIIYLRANGFPAAAAQLSSEASVTDEELAANARVQGLLEKKWTSVVRLQRKVLDLEAQLKEARENGGRAGSSKSGGEFGIPRPPARHVLKGHRGAVNCVAMHPEFTLAASSSEDGTIKLWDTESGEFERTLKGHTAAVTSVTFSADGKKLASASADMTIKLWDAESFECVTTLRGHEHTVSGVRFIPDSDELVSVSRDGSARVWDTVSGFAVRRLEGHREWVRCVDVDAKGALCATGSSDQSVRVWDVTSGKCLHILHEHEHVVECVTFAPGNTLLALRKCFQKEGKAHDKIQFLASGSRDRMIYIWNALTGERLLQLSGHDNWVRDIVFLPSGKHVVSCADDRSLRVWDVRREGSCKVLDDVHDGFVSSIAVNAQQRVVCSASVDTSLKVWECR